MHAKIRKAERHGWAMADLGVNGCYMSRVGRDGRVYVAYLSK